MVLVKILNNNLEKESLTNEEKIKTIAVIIDLYSNNYFTIATALTLIQKVLKK
jgi:hypothetical protein